MDGDIGMLRTPFMGIGDDSLCA